MSTSIHSHTFRPTRRDLILIILTITSSYLLFSPRPDPTSLLPPISPITSSTSSPTVSSSSTPKKYIPDWLWPIKTSTSSTAGCPPTTGIREETFDESIQSYGWQSTNPSISPLIDVAEGGTGLGVPLGMEEWDQGNEEFGVKGLQPHSSVAGHEMKTELLGHAPGWTLMDRVYIFNGSFYVVTENRTAWPELVHMTSTGKPANNEPGNAELRYPTGREIIFISPKTAANLWGDRVLRMGGTTWLFNDGQFIDHYYHFSAELFLGAWRAYTSLDPNITPKGETTLPPPRRAWFLHQNLTDWRDKPRFNPTVLFNAFPSISLLYPADWADLALATNPNTSTPQPRAYMLEQALLADRSAAFYGDYTAPTSRTVASALYVGDASVWWWEPIRRQILRVAGVEESVLNRNLEGWGAIDPVHFGPQIDPLLSHRHPIGKRPKEDDMELSHTDGMQVIQDYKPVITYISRQSSRRRLSKISHESLVRALEESSDKLGYELNIVEAEKLGLEEQFALAGKTTIMLGVHGNGLTHLLWMPATPRSAVIEMYFRGGFARDYQWTAHCLGIRHYGVRHDEFYTAPVLPEVEYPEGFHGTEITVDGPFVAQLIEDRLSGKI